jgi:hypothetical protein
VIVEKTNPCEFKPRGEMDGEKEMLIFRDFTEVVADFLYEEHKWRRETGVC